MRNHHVTLLDSSRSRREETSAFAPRTENSHIRPMFPARRRLLLAVSLFVVPLLLPARAAAPSHVQASLVAADASVKPGQPITVALRFVHDPHWHTYWIQPGTG